MLGLSPAHLLLFGVVAILLFGNRLPSVARSLGRSLVEFKKGMNELTAAKEDEPKSPTLASYEALERELASRRALDEANARDLANKKVGSSETSSSENLYTERQAE